MTEPRRFQAMIGPMTGAELRRLRKRASLTQEALAGLSEVSAHTIIRWENDQVPIPTLAARGLLAILAEKRAKG